MVQGLPLPLLKICDFGYSKAHFMSAPKSKVCFFVCFSFSKRRGRRRRGLSLRVSSSADQHAHAHAHAPPSLEHRHPSPKRTHKTPTKTTNTTQHNTKQQTKQTHEQVGTLAYMAPEIIKATGNYDGNKADICAC